ncbi:hypothetical protein ACQ9BO_03930 [Flavobacterium sp. P21]|uniref:hypothetical protein n=1 Tax=Flavobacterium sp. P21 TaxID=3423948 RepID=UPI003D677E9D
MTTYNDENPVQTIVEYVTSDNTDYSQVSEKLKKEFNVLKLIDGYRTRGHLFTKTNPVRDRRQSSPTLDIENFGLSATDLSTVFDLAQTIGMVPSSLQDIVNRLKAIYCQHIGIEYMYIRNPGVVKWIQDKLAVNVNQPTFSTEEKKTILNKLNEAVSFENFLHTKYVGQKRFSLEGGESIIPALDALIEQVS